VPPFKGLYRIKTRKVDSLSYKTKFQNSATVDKKWVLVDADSQVLGRLASQVAAIIRGKNKPGFTPHVDCGDNVVVINSDKIKLTGKKWNQKIYVRYSGYPGGQKSLTARQVKAKSSTRIVEAAVRGMLPKNRLGRAIFNNLFVYEGGAHPHEAQQPKPVKLQS
jgi:large subunit ribosomal protein L13